MKILHLLYSGLGGHGNVFFSIVKADRLKEFEHEALFNGIEEVKPEYIQRCLDNNINWQFVKKSRGLDLGFYRNLAADIKRADPDIIFLHGSTQILAAKIAVIFSRRKRKIIVRETQANQLKTKQDWFWLITAMLLADKIVFLTREYKAEIRKKLSLVYKEKKTALIPNGIDVQLFRPVKKEDTGTVVIGMQSRIVKIKDHETLLRAFASLLKDPANAGKRMVLRIAGDGDCRKGLEALAESLAIAQQVEFTGILAQQELITFLNGVDIYVHASFGETMSTAIMEAMASGKPIIASDVPGINNMIENKVTGILVPPADVQAMADAISALLHNSSLASQLSENACKKANEEYSNTRMLEGYKSIFK